MSCFSFFKRHTISSTERAISEADFTTLNARAREFMAWLKSQVKKLNALKKKRQDILDLYEKEKMELYAYYRHHQHLKHKKLVAEKKKELRAAIKRIESNNRDPVEKSEKKLALKNKYIEEIKSLEKDLHDKLENQFQRIVNEIILFEEDMRVRNFINNKYALYRQYKSELQKTKKAYIQHNKNLLESEKKKIKTDYRIAPCEKGKSLKATAEDYKSSLQKMEEVFERQLQQRRSLIPDEVARFKKAAAALDEIKKLEKVIKSNCRVFCHSGHFKRNVVNTKLVSDFLLRNKVVINTKKDFIAWLQENVQKNKKLYKEFEKNHEKFKSKLDENYACIVNEIREKLREASENIEEYITEKDTYDKRVRLAIERLKQEKEEKLSRFEEKRLSKIETLDREIMARCRVYCFDDIVSNSKSYDERAQSVRLILSLFIRDKDDHNDFDEYTCMPTPKDFAIALTSDPYKRDGHEYFSNPRRHSGLSSR